MANKALSIEKMTKKIPRSSRLYNLPLDIKKKVIQDIIDERNTLQIAKELNSLGYEEITRQVIIRVKDRIWPYWLKLNSGDAFFKRFEDDIKPKLERLEFLINKQYENLIKALEYSIEETDSLELMPVYKEMSVDDIGLKDLLQKYYDGTITELDRKFLLTFTRRKTPAESLDKKIKSFMGLIKDFVDLKERLANMVDIITSSELGRSSSKSGIGQRLTPVNIPKEDSDDILEDIDVANIQNLVESDADDTGLEEEPN